MRVRFLAIAFVFCCVPLALRAQDSSSSGLDLGALDTSVSPCTNFYQYACGTWRKNNPIPPDQSRWGRFNELFERNQKIARDILEKVGPSAANRSALDQKVGDFYAACMDEAAIERKALAPLKPWLDEIAAVSSKEQLAGLIKKLHVQGVPVFFRFGARPDPKNASVEIADFDQGGLGLPDRDYYLKTDGRSQDILKKYQAHVAAMFDLAATAEHKTSDAQEKAAAVLAIETALATSSQDRVARRNPDNTYHPMTVKDLPSLSPDFDWNRYLTAAATPSFTKLNVGSPDYFKGFDQLLKTRSLADIQSYLEWQVLRAAAPALPSAFVNENFQFYGKTLSGAKELQPRWKRCVTSTDQALGEALGQKYVQVAFSPESKTRMLQMVAEIEKAMQQDIETAAWMTDVTKKEALGKLTAVANKIGYPDHWRDYSSVQVEPSDYLGNRARAVQFEIRRNLNKIGKSVDKSEWGMTPPTVNAYYSPPQNNINFPAGILQPPFFGAKADDAVNYGAIGVVIGHELTHGFDDQGRRYDGAGKLRDWWSAADATNFTERADCVVEEYGSFSPVDGVKLNGKLTLGENAADNGGIHLAYMALMDRLAGKTLPKKDGYSQEQLFFLGYAQVWCQNNTDESARLLAVTDPHSPGQFRVNGVVRNLKEFESAFSCKAGDPMVSENPCRVW